MRQTEEEPRISDLISKVEQGQVFLFASMHGVNPHISVSKQTDDPGKPGHPSWLHCREMTLLFTRWGFLPLANSSKSLCIPSSLKCAFIQRCLMLFISPSSIQSLLHGLIVTPVVKVD